MEVAQFLQKKQVLHLKKGKSKEQGWKNHAAWGAKAAQGQGTCPFSQFCGVPHHEKGPRAPTEVWGPGGDRDRDRSCRQRGRGGAAGLLAAARGWPSLTGCRNLGPLPTPDKSLLFACSGFDAVIASSEPALERKRKGKEKGERGRRAAYDPAAAKAGRILPGDAPAPSSRSWLLASAPDLPAAGRREGAGAGWWQGWEARSWGCREPAGPPAHRGPPRDEPWGRRTLAALGRLGAGHVRTSTRRDVPLQSCLEGTKSVEKKARKCFWPRRRSGRHCPGRGR